MRREDFIGRIASALMEANIPLPPEVPSSLPALGPADLQALFKSRAREVDTVVHGPVSKHGVPTAVSGIASGHGCRSFMAWDQLPVPGIPAALAANGLTHIDDEVVRAVSGSSLDYFGDVALGVTGALAGLAESGSVVLSHPRGESRLASVVPEVHIALLEVARIERALAHWVARHPEHGSESANLVVITGPSRTGDIEQLLNLGVHGPRHLHVVLIK